MLTLIIKERGHMIDLPGMAPFRTPAEIDVTKLPLNVLILKMKAYNINEYQIISETGGKKIVYKKEDLEKKKTKELKGKKKDVDQVSALTKRFNRLENLLATLIKGTKTNDDLEQINEKLDQLSGKVNGIKNIKQVIVKDDTIKDTDDEIDEPDTFIPQIETTGMKIQSGDHKTIEKDKDVEDNADLLSQLTKKK